MLCIYLISFNKYMSLSQWTIKNILYLCMKIVLSVSLILYIDHSHVH